MAKVRFEQQICAYTQVNVEDVQYITYFNISLPLSEKMEKKIKRTINIQDTFKLGEQGSKNNSLHTGKTSMVC